MPIDDITAEIFRHLWFDVPVRRFFWKGVTEEDSPVYMEYRDLTVEQCKQRHEEALNHLFPMIDREARGCDRWPAYIFANGEEMEALDFNDVVEAALDIKRYGSMDLGRQMRQLERITSKASRLKAFGRRLDSGIAMFMTNHRNRIDSRGRRLADTIGLILENKELTLASIDLERHDKRAYAVNDRFGVF